MKKLDRNYFWLIVPFIAALISISRVWPVLPAVMQDEYVYSMQARYTPFAEQLYPNYLFSALFSTTSACGTDFYSCGKGLNVIFFLATLTFIFLIAKRLIGVTAGALIAAVAALSPLHVYVSYFMPESMYFAFMTATIWLALVAGQKSALLNWTMVGAMLGLTALVKPHAIFALPAFAVFAFVVIWREDLGGLRKALIGTGSSLGAFAVVKFGLGFAFAGTKGLSIFGSSYESSLDTFVSTAAASKPPLSLPAAAGTQNQVSLAAEAADNPGFFEVFIPHSFAHLGILVILAGLPIILAVSVFKTALTKKQPIGAASQYLILIGTIAVSYAIVVAAFEGVVSVLGDDHTNRLITRYYEFLWPLLLIAAAVFGRFVESKWLGRLLQSTIVIGLIIYFWVYLAGVNQSFADSILLSGFLSSPGVIGFVAVLGIVGALVWIFNANAGSKLVVYVLTPLVLIIGGFSSQSLLLTQVGTQKAFFDIAGQTSKPFLDGVEGSKILIVGVRRTEVFVAKFWIDKPGIRDIYIEDSQSLANATVGDAEYVLNLSNTSTQGEQVVVAEGDGFKLLKMGSAN